MNQQKHDKDLKVYGYIYITENLVNGKKYIGKHKCCENSRDDKYYLGSGKYLKLAIKKYGRKSFKLSILEYCFSPEELNEKEISWIEKYNAMKDPNFYNIASGGNATFYDYASIEDQLRVRKIMSEKAKNKVVSEETRKKHSIAYQNQSEEYKEELRLKLLSINKQRKYTEAQSLQLANITSKTIIVNLNSGKIFKSIKEASIHYNIPKHIQFKASNTISFHYGFYWFKISKKDLDLITLKSIEEEISKYFIHKLIYCKELNLIFENTKKVGEYFNKKDLSAINSCLRGKTKSIYSYHLSYCDKCQVIDFIRKNFNIVEILKNLEIINKEEETN